MTWVELPSGTLIDIDKIIVVRPSRLSNAEDGWADYSGGSFFLNEDDFVALHERLWWEAETIKESKER